MTRLVCMNKNTGELGIAVPLYERSEVYHLVITESALRFDASDPLAYLLISEHGYTLALAVDVDDEFEMLGEL